MIAIVDDDPVSLAFAKEVLEGAGHRVLAFPAAEAALAGLADRAPDLVLSDVVMPEMSGLELRRAYGARFPARRTPFVFLSSLGDPSDVVRGLDAGADDYLQKPVHPKVLLAKVRAHLRRGAQGAPRFQGDLALFPFDRIVEFCEQQGLTGEVEVEAGTFRAVVGFRGGVPLDRRAGDAETISRALELQAGAFVIRAQPVDFAAMAEAALPDAGGEAPLDPSARPPGRLSAVTVGGRMVQLQTEYVTTPSPTVVSVALRDGRTLLKRASRASGTREEIGRQVEQQHAALEGEVRARLAELVAARSAASVAPPPAQDPAPSPAPAGAADAEGAPGFRALFEAGLEAFLAGDLQAALARFEQAQALEPGHAALEVNLAVVRKRLGRPG